MQCVTCPNFDPKTNSPRPEFVDCCSGLGNIIQCFLHSLHDMDVIYISNHDHGSMIEHCIFKILEPTLRKKED